MNHVPTDNQINNQAISHGNGVADFMDLPDTMRQDYVLHEPMALFPEPSSTVPNATQTQRRLLEGLRGAGLLGSGSDSGAPQSQHPPQPSVPWSDILNFSPVGAEEQSDYTNQRSEPASETVHHIQTSERTQNTSISQPARRGSSVQLRDCPPRHEVLQEHFKSKEDTPPSLSVHPSQNIQPSVNNAQFEETTQCSPSAPARKMQKNVNCTQNSDDELMTMGLPVEQYKPRPSRSRSLKVSINEPVDYSIRPEKAAKGAKRRNATSSAATTRSASANDSIGTPQKVKQICDMGFTPTSTGQALKRNHGDVIQTIEWLVNNGMGEDELAQPNTPKRKPASREAAANGANAADQSTAMITPTVEDITATRMSPPAADVVSGADTSPRDPQGIMDNHLNQPLIPLGDHYKSPKVQVVIPSKSPRMKSIQEGAQPQEFTASKKPKRRKTTSDLPEPDADTPCDPAPVVEPMTVKKKRGRPKKVADANLPSKEIQEEKNEAKILLKSPAEEVDASIDIMHTIEATAEHAATLVESGDHKTGDAPKSPSLSHKDSSFQRPLSSTRTPEQATKTPSRSPTSKGKVSYRVGLSRRARIAPLLRTLKK